jgi:hypothetical protein
LRIYPILFTVTAAAKNWIDLMSARGKKAEKNRWLQPPPRPIGDAPYRVYGVRCAVRKGGGLVFKIGSLWRDYPPAETDMGKSLFSVRVDSDKASKDDCLEI